MDRRSFLSGAASLGALTTTAARAEEAGPFRIRDLYNRDRSFSDLALSSEGKRVSFQGFMAPPLKAEARFFVLTKMPMAVCPFCEPDTDWPNDILPIYTKRVVKVIPFNVRIQATGLLEIGRFIDEDTGFYSLVRLTDARYGE